MKKSNIIIVIAILIQLSFYISAVKTHTLDYFFPWGNVHEWQGMDFYQVPRSAYAWLRGGSLTGELPEGVPDYIFGNGNVYHPALTLLIGLPLQLMRPQWAFYAWWTFHLFVTFSLAFLLYKTFRGHKNIAWAMLFHLAIFPQYLEIWNGQYHFLFDAGIFLLLYYSLHGGETVGMVIAYFLTLLVKPVGLLWQPVFLLKKKFKTAFFVALLFAAFTVPFIVTGEGAYYLDNILNRLQHPIGGPPGIFTIDALLRYWSIPPLVVAGLKAVTLIAFVIVFRFFRMTLFEGLFLLTAYYLLFYDFVFEYHYTSLAPFLAFGVLTHKAFQSRFGKLLGFSYLLPTPFFLFHALQFQARGHYVTDHGWVILVLFRTIPLILLVGAVIWKAKKQASR